MRSRCAGPASSVSNWRRPSCETRRGTGIPRIPALRPLPVLPGWQRSHLCRLRGPIPGAGSRGPLPGVKPGAGDGGVAARTFCADCRRTSGGSAASTPSRCSRAIRRRRCGASSTTGPGTGPPSSGAEHARGPSPGGPGGETGWVEFIRRESAPGGVRNQLCNHWRALAIDGDREQPSRLARKREDRSREMSCRTHPMLTTSSLVCSKWRKWPASAGQSSLIGVLATNVSHLPSRICAADRSSRRVAFGATSSGGRSTWLMSSRPST